MKRRSRAGQTQAKARSRKALKLKGRKAPKAVTRGGSAHADRTEVARLTRERNEALEQQIATSEVLRIMSSSPSNLDPVFEAILANATRICEAKFATLYLCDADAFRVVAMHNTPPAYAEVRQREPLVRPPPDSVLGRVSASKDVVHIADVKQAKSYIERNPFTVAGVELGGYRTVLGVPILQQSALIGVVNIYRQEVHPFTNKQIALVQNFADEAVIAIENARLLRELRESLREQTATTEVLRVISSSPGNLQPVFEAMLENAVRICGAKFGNLWLYDGEFFRIGATSHGAPSAYVEYLRREGPFRVDPRVGIGRLVQTKQTYQVADITTQPTHDDKGRVATIELAGARTLLGVPMLKDGEVIGSIVIYHREVLPFTDKQVALVENFAAQAVIAIENTRLLNELRESLQEQTATAEVLQVVSSSPGDLQPVFEAMLEKAVRICDAKFGNIYRWDGHALHAVASRNTPPGYAEARKHLPLGLDQRTPVSRMVETKKVVQVTDLAAEPDYTERGHPGAVAAVELGGVRTFLAVPMLKENELVGAFIVSRQEVRPFTEKQITLVENFAAQAVIAVENARLLNELRQRTADLTEALEQQTATSDVLKAISSSPGDLQGVFETMLANATRLCEATHGHVWSFDGEQLHAVAVRGDEQFVKWLREHNPARPLVGSSAERIVKGEPFVHVADRRDEPAYRNNQTFRELVDSSGIRASLSVALCKGETLLGMIVVYRKEVRPFSEKQIDLVKNFAAQAVIAIENARLLNELRQRTEEVEKLNQHLEQRVTDQVDEIERMGRLRRFLPPQVADLIVASGTEKQLESHRREITALFCDLRGFTGFSEASAPEDVMTLLRDYHAAIGEIIIKYSGTLERYAGDGVMVVFNDPVQVDNPALRAVQMALETREAMGALTEKWRELGHDVGFGIGIAHGYATLGTIGFEGRFDYAAIGTVSNVASRLCDEAKPGQILISPRVFMAVKDAVTVEPVGEFTLKGIGRPLAAYNVLAAAPPNA